MKKAPLEFHFSGQADLEARKKTDTFSKEDLAIVEKLNAMRGEITDELRERLNQELSEHRVEIQNVYIHFYAGSIQWDGIITIADGGAKIAGNTGLIVYIRSVLKAVCDNTIARRLPPNLRTINTEVELSIEHSLRSRSADVWEFSTKKILLWVTVLNLVIFFGGTFLSVIHVPSILDKYSEAKKKLNEASELFQDKERNFKSELAIFEIEIKNLETRRMQLSQKLDAIETDEKNLEDKISSLNLDTIALEKSLENFCAARTSISLKNLWLLSTWPVRILMCFIAGCTLGLLAVLITLCSKRFTT